MVGDYLQIPSNDSQQGRFDGWRPLERAATFHAGIITLTVSRRGSPAARRRRLPAAWRGQRFRAPPQLYSVRPVPLEL